jgi:hypothetical protein
MTAGLSAAILLLVLLPVVGVGVGAWYFSDDATLRRMLKASRRHAIADLPESMPGRIVGTVVAAVAGSDILEAPLSRRRCVYYRVEVEQRSGDRWRRVLFETHSIPFVIDDGTGRAVFDPAHARVSLTDDARESSGTFDDATPREQALLRSHGLRSQGIVFNKNLRYREAVIEIGETVAIAGCGVREFDPDAGAGAGYRDAAPTRVRLKGSRRHPLLISDKPETWS